MSFLIPLLLIGSLTGTDASVPDPSVPDPSVHDPSVPDPSVPDALKNHYRLTLNYYNVNSCSSTPYNTSYYVQQCESNGTNLPNCCLTMLKGAGYIGTNTNFMLCNTLTNESSYYVSCEQYYTDTQVEYGKIFGYIVLAIICVLAFVLVVWTLRKCCCRRNNGYDHI